MKQTLFATMALAGFAASSLAVAAPQSGAVPNFIQPPVAATLPSKAAGSTPTVGTPMANPYRAYPPSCASYPLPDKPSGPVTKAVVPVMTSYQGLSSKEDITVSVWRLPCSSSGASVPYNDEGVANAMTLVRFDRADDSNPSPLLPYLPLLLVKQGDIDFTTAKSYVRVAAEPNTVVSEVRAGSIMATSGTYVLENYALSGAGHFNFNAAFTLRVDGGLIRYGIAPTSIDVPAYAPNADTYPDAGKPLPLDGYAAAQYINTERNEGLIVQVAEGYDADHVTRRQVGFDLLTEDASGNPFWIIGNAAFDPVAGGVRSLDIPVSYVGENNATQSWGTAHLVMNHCNALTVTYTPKDALADGVPSISGPISYSRLLSANGMACE